MTDKNIIAKVSAELKAQGINATDAQIESAIGKVTAKQELSLETMDNVAGGFGWADLAKLAPDAIKAIKELLGGGGGENKDGGNGGGSGSGGSGGSTNNTNTNSGKQVSQQGEGNQLSNSGGNITIS